MSENGSIVLRKPDLDDLAELGNLMISSGFFKDSAKVAQAAVKVLAGRELGLGPVESMRAFHIVEGKIEMSADLLAQRVKASEKYDYQVGKLTNEECTIAFYEHEEQIGASTFTIDDAKRAGLVRERTAWVTYPRNMLFARALSNGVAWFCPDVAGGARLYVEGEVGGEVLDIDPELEMDEPTTTAAEAGGPPKEFAGRAIAAPVVTVDTETGEINPPDKATRPQLLRLFALAGELGLDDDGRKLAAGVASFNDLTKTQASDLIGVWTDAASRGEGVAGVPPSGAVSEDTAASDTSERPEDVAGEEVPPDDAYGECATAAEPTSPAPNTGPPSDEQWSVALRHFAGNRALVMRYAAVVLNRSVGMSTITADELAQVITTKLEKKV